MASESVCVNRKKNRQAGGLMVDRTVLSNDIQLQSWDI